jgi:hypothetical protein
MNKATSLPALWKNIAAVIPCLFAVPVVMLTGCLRARLIEIHSSKGNPSRAFVAVTYRDLKSKRTFAFMMLLFALADTGEKEPLPMFTIPAQ